MASSFKMSPSSLLYDFFSQNYNIYIYILLHFNYDINIFNI